MVVSGLAKLLRNGNEIMLPSQRALFDIPRDVAYFNAAGWSPLPRAVQDAGRAGVARKGQPWTLPASFAGEQYERARNAAAALINAAPADVALIPSIGYGVATAAKLLTIPSGSRVLLLEDDHGSPVLEWMTRAETQRFTVDIVKRPSDGDWTAAVLEAIAKPSAAPIGVASISSIHWSDGGRIDIAAVAPALRKQGAAILVDATHSVGVEAIDVAALDPDFLMFPTYKWVLGPYGRAFLYIAKRRQGGVPLEQTAFGRRSVSAEQSVYLTDIRYVDSAMRFDMGERDHFISMEMAALGMEMVAEWGHTVLTERLLMLTRRIADGLADSGVLIPSERLRAPHVLCVGLQGGDPVQIVKALATEGVYVAPRVGRIRISPHVYNDEVDVDRLVTVFRNVLARRMG
jgi:selenocysteine lyase/cysteine desulfurase